MCWINFSLRLFWFEDLLDFKI